MKRTGKSNRSSLSESIPATILFIRNQKVIIDSDLAKIYGVSTKRLNEQVRRNLDRFPEDFLFELTENEKKKVVANCDHLIMIKFSPHPPYAFTEHGAVMVANLLNSPTAVKASILVVRALWLVLSPATQTGERWLEGTRAVCDNTNRRTTRRRLYC